MTLDARTWSQVTALFDRLVELPPDQRDREIDPETIPAPVREWLNRLLAAHDQPSELLVDRTVAGIAAAMGSGAEVADDAGPEDAEAMLADRRFGAWKTLEVLGRGGMGTVLLGERADGRYEQTVAIKVLRPGALAGLDSDSMSAEVRLLARLDHPGIARLIDGGVAEDGLPWLAMEYVAGEPIDAWCTKHNASLELRIELVRQVAAALAHAHQRLVVHADIKPSNVLVSDDGRARLVDFGISALMRDDALSETPPLLRCSPAWCAPEQLRGAPPEVAHDVFGVGALLLRLSTGERVRDGSRITRWLGGQCPQDPPPAPLAEHALPGLAAREMRGDLEAICHKSLSGDPAQRYGSIEALDSDLERWQNHFPARALQHGPASLLSMWFRRNRIPAIAGALAALAMLVGTSVALWQAELARNSAERARMQAERADTVRDFVLSLFRAADPLRAGGAELDTRVVLAQASEQLENNRELTLDVRIEILNTLADVQGTLGWTEDAAALLDSAQALIDSGPVPPHLHAETIYQKAMLEVAASEFDSALPMLQQAEQILDSGSNARQQGVRVRIRIQIGALLARLGKTDEARLALDRAEQAIAKLPEPDLEMDMLLASSRGVAEYNAGRPEQALQHMQRTVDIQRKIGNSQAASMVISLGNLAAVSAQLGRLDDALAFDAEAVEIARRSYPEGHTAIGRALYAYGDTLRQLGRLDEAETALLEARRIQQRADKPAEVELLELTRARVLLAAGRYAQAAQLIARFRPGLEQRWGPTSNTALQALEVEIAARAALDQRELLDRLEEDARTLFDAMDTQQRGRPLAGLLYWRLGETRLARGDPEPALDWLERGRAHLTEPIQPSVQLRLSALALRIAQARGESAPASELDRLMVALEQPGANPDARAYAWCALAEAARAQGLTEILDTAQSSLETLQTLATLSAESTRMLAAMLDR